MSLAAADDGSVLVGRRNGIFRFLPEGDMDRSFRSPAYRDGDADAFVNVNKIELVHGKILVLAGWGLGQRLIRLNKNGSVDSTFRIPELRVDNDRVSY